MPDRELDACAIGDLCSHAHHSFGECGAMCRCPDWNRKGTTADVEHQFRKGDRVYVTDPGLAAMRAIMTQATGKDVPNHHGTVEEIWEDGTVLINFDEDGVEGAGNAAPYPPNEVARI